MGAVVRMFVQPLAVFSVRLNGKPVEQAVIDLSVCYFVINIFMVAVGAMILCVSDHLDMLTSMSAVISALMNIGPGFGGVGRPRILPSCQSSVNGFWLSICLSAGWRCSPP